MSDSEVARVILLDEPSSEDLFHGKGHDRTASALAAAIRDFRRADRAIGLDGAWGSGKSSVVGIAERKLQDGNGKTKYHFFTFDIWKSQGSAFRRSFLERLVSWAKASFPNKTKTLTEIEKNIKGKTREVDTNSSPRLGLYGIGVLLSVPLLPVYLLWSKDIFDKLANKNNEADFLWSWPMVFIYVFLLITLVTAAFKYRKLPIADGGRWERIGLAISQTLLIGAKQFERQTVKQYIREVDPNDFEFQSVLREILGAIQDDHTRIIIVLDNIDRLPSEEIDEYWAMVRSIFSRSHTDGSGTKHSHITAIVPYDRNHIAPAKEQSNSSTLRAKELFAKTFDEVLNVAPPVMSNTREFFDQKVRQALPRFADEDGLFRVYLIFNWLIDKEGGKATPRQVIAFINEVSGLFALHSGRIPLPTAAAYLAVRDRLEASPSLLAKEKIVDDQLRSLAADASLDKHLASILFNVEPDLAFQLLLDAELRSAIGESTPDRLIALSNSPGFGVRIDEVFGNGVAEWRSAGRLATAIGNICDLLNTYNGDGADLVRQSAIEAFLATETISTFEEVRFRKLIRTSAKEERTKIIEHLLSTIVAGIGPPDKIDDVTGSRLASLFSTIAEEVHALDPAIGLEGIWKRVALPADLLLIFGFALASCTLEVTLAKLAKPTLDLSAEAEFLKQAAIDRPGDTFLVLGEFRKAGILTDDCLLTISTRLSTALMEESEDNDLFASQAKLMGKAWALMSLAARKKNDLSALQKDATFYENMHAAFSKSPESEALPFALLVLEEPYIGGKLGIPVRIAPNGQAISAAQEEFAWLTGVLNGDTLLTDKQIDVFTNELNSYSRVPHWIFYGRDNPNNKLAPAVTRSAFANSKIPWIASVDIIRIYAYLKTILETEMETILPGLGQRIAAGSLDKLTIDGLPLQLLSDTVKYAQTEWKTFHDRTAAVLDSVSKDEWLGHFIAGDNYFQLLIAKVQSSGYCPDSTEIRDSLLRFVLGVLDGTNAPAQAIYDPILDAFDPNYHLEFFRLVREKVSGVSVETIATAAQIMPKLMVSVIRSGEKQKPEKENLIRFILWPALEGGVVTIIDAFLELPKRVVADFVRSSDKSVQDALEPALRALLKHSDYGYVRRVTEHLQGRRSKTLIQTLFGLPAKDEDE
ncbi:P-loop NTPase fold protein [Rhizobium sp. No.120]